MGRCLLGLLVLWLCPLPAEARATLANAGSDTHAWFGGTLTQLAVTTTVLALLASAAVARASRSSPGRVITVQYKLTHLLPASLQSVIFAYWAIYWRELSSFVAPLLLQVVWAYALDALLSVRRRGQWTLTAGPVPIVMSSNLVVLFRVEAWPLALLAITAAMASKAMLRRRGRHVFNPSAFGVACVALLNLLWPTLGYGDRAHQFALAPHMTELVVVLALVVQLRLKVVLITAGAAMSLWGLRAAGLHVLSPEWAPVTLILLLLISDPATTPKSAAGKLLFGLMIGALMGISGHLLEALGYSDFYAKVLPLPLANALAPRLDTYGRLFTERSAALRGCLAVQHNWVHVLVWLALIVPAVFRASGEEQFHRATGALHIENQTPYVNVAMPLSCQQAPMYCEPFRFDLEVRRWWGTPP